MDCALTAGPGESGQDLELVVAEDGDDCPGLGRYVGVRTRQVDDGGGDTQVTGR
jgi:hypothetical protein